MAEGMRQLSKYQIAEELGAGGFATVFRAIDTTLDREVALKILHPPLLADRHFVQNFRQEARTLARLRHPQIITIYEVGEADGRMFIAMDLVHGLNLANSISKRANHRIPWPDTLELLKPIADALDYAHAQQIVHRDLKPANILIDTQRGGMLTDFGFAKLMAENAASMTVSGGIVGTPGYIAPEVWESNAAEPPVDIYALGCIAYEMLTGDVLFQGQTPIQAMRAHDRGPQFPPQWPAGVPAGVEAVLAQALARDVAARYPSAGAFWQALSSVGQQPVVVAPPRPVQPAPQPPKQVYNSLTPESLEDTAPSAPLPGVAIAQRAEALAPTLPEALAAPEAAAEMTETVAETAALPSHFKSWGLALALLPLSVILDIGGGELVKRLQLPLWLDNGGTILMGVLFGPWIGALAALTGRTVWWLLGWNDKALWFSPSVVAVGLLAGFAGQLGLFRFNPPRWLSALVGGVLGFALPLLVLVFQHLERHEGTWPSLPATNELAAQNAPPLLVAAALGMAIGFFMLKRCGYAGAAGLLTGMLAAVVSAPISAQLFGGDPGTNVWAGIVGNYNVPDPLDKFILFLIVFYLVRLLPTSLRQRFPATRGSSNPAPGALDEG